MKFNRFRTTISLFVLVLITTTINAQRRPSANHKNVRHVPAKQEYRRPVPVIRTARVLPIAAAIIVSNNLKYHYSNGLYYRPYNGVYVIVPAPIGVHITVLPVGYSTMIISGMSYYYFEGNYYQSTNDGYISVKAPKSITIATLPEDAEEIEINGKRFFTYNNILYKVVTTPDGKAFKMVGNLNAEEGI